MGGGQAFVTYAEDKSSYACPRITPDGQEEYPDDYVAYRVERYVRRTQGRPVNVQDTKANGYWLECEVVPGQRKNVQNADPDDITVTRTGPARWTVTAGQVRFTLHVEPAEVCIESAS